MFWKNNRNFLRTWCRHKHIKWFTNTAFCWLVLEYCERKLLLAGTWRLMLECYERKILLADVGAEQNENLPELLSTRIKQSKKAKKKVQWWLVDSIEMVKLWLSSETEVKCEESTKVFNHKKSPGSQIVKQVTWKKATEDTNNARAQIDIDMGNESSTPHALPS